MPVDARPQARKNPEAYSLEYGEDFLGAENDADAGRSFAATEWYYPDRFLKQRSMTWLK
jgi:hypothetical protein